MKVELFDTTFRDGLQEEGVDAKNLAQALKAIEAIDRIGVLYHETGFAVSNAAARERIKEAAKLKLGGRVAAFGRTLDSDIEAILELGVPVGVAVGKTRFQDAVKVIRRGAEENLRLIESSIRKLVQAGREAIYDAEHFFQGLYEDDSNYALTTLLTAFRAGARRIVLCDTNGKMTPRQISQAISAVVDSGIPIEIIGIHCHNDRGRANANSEAAWSAGVGHIQGTFGGFGERNGNADLVTLIPNLVLDGQAEGISPEQLGKLTETYQFVCAVLNQSPNPKHPWVGAKSFYTETGMHQSGLDRDPANYWHVNPAVVGNSPRVGVTDQSGRANLAAKAKELGVEIPVDRLSAVSEAFTDLVNNGYDFNLAEASFILFLLRQLGRFTDPFEFREFEVHTRKTADCEATTVASLRLKLGKRATLHNADGDGPVNALDEVLRRTLRQIYPQLLDVRLTSFRVDIFDIQQGTAAKVQVFIQWSDGQIFWSTMGADTNIIEASWEAIKDGYAYKMLRNGSLKDGLPVQTSEIRS